MVARGREAGICHFLTICTHLAKAQAILEVARAYPDVSASIGTHPHEAEAEAHYTLADITSLAREDKVVALGECGLDYHYNHSPQDVQHAVFRTHIRAALETGLPLIIHTREAEADTMRLLREESAGQGVRGVMHCFSSSRALAEEALEFGFMISFSGILTFRNAEELREIARIVPDDRLLVETDAPFLAPIPKRGGRNRAGLRRLHGRDPGDGARGAGNTVGRADDGQFLLVVRPRGGLMPVVPGDDALINLSARPESPTSHRPLSSRVQRGIPCFVDEQLNKGSLTCVRDDGLGVGPAPTGRQIGCVNQSGPMGEGSCWTPPL